MEPKYVAYECENCGGIFYRAVTNVLVDDGAHCEVEVEILKDADGDNEEFPMCPCLGGDATRAIIFEDEDEEEVTAE